MPSIHLIERLNNVHKVPGVPNEWESGYWVVSEETAQRLIGSDLYLHSGQSEPSHFGGEIFGFRVHRNGSDLDGRMIFRIKFAPRYKGVRAGPEGWGNEKKIVW